MPPATRTVDPDRFYMHEEGDTAADAEARDVANIVCECVEQSNWLPNYVTYVDLDGPHRKREPRHTHPYCGLDRSYMRDTAAEGCCRMLQTLYICAANTSDGALLVRRCASLLTETGTAARHSTHCNRAAPPRSTTCARTRPPHPPHRHPPAAPAAADKSDPT